MVALRGGNRESGLCYLLAISNRCRVVVGLYKCCGYETATWVLPAVNCLKCLMTSKAAIHSRSVGFLTRICFLKRGGQQR